jgi:hypothetical protein
MRKAWREEGYEGRAVLEKRDSGSIAVLMDSVLVMSKQELVSIICKQEATLKRLKGQGVCTLSDTAAAFSCYEEFSEVLLAKRVFLLVAA